MVFVFGSNRSGIHGAGAARYAAVHKGAEYGIGEGPTGACYALPTKGFNITQISLDDVSKHVQKFLLYAEKHIHQNFQVTQVGCGLGGFTREQIAPLFKSAPKNCFFDDAWRPVMESKESGSRNDGIFDYRYWGTF